MKITFHYKSAAVSGGTTSGDYCYKSTDDNYGDQYGLVNGEYVKLTREEAKSWKKKGYYYTLVATTNNNTSNSPEKYGIHSSGIGRVFYNSGFLSLGRGWHISDSVWSTDYSGDLYTRSTGTSGEVYTGTRYTISGTSMNPTTSDSDTQYGKEGNTIYELEYTRDYYYYTYNGTIYNGDRYAIDTDNTFYHGTLYKKTANGFVETTDESGTLYGTRTDGIYEVLTSHTAHTAHNWKTPDGSIYTGTRYIRYKRVSDNTYPYELEWEGLYGSSFSDNDITSIGNLAFAHCPLLTKLEISDSVTDIAANAFEGCDNLVIYCAKESYALQYAIDNGIEYVITNPDPASYMRGDANRDGKVSVRDATVIQLTLASYDAGEFNIAAADVDGNGLNINDVTKIQRYLAGLGNPYNIGELVTESE